MIAIATLALTLAAPNFCAPADAAALRAQLEPLLGTIDRPTSPERWKHLPPEARAALEAIAADPAELPTRRAAALSGLTALGGDGALHRRLAEDPGVPYLVRAGALRSLATLLPADQRSAPLQRLLREDADRRIRAAAAEALARASPTDGCAAVRGQTLREGTDGRVRFERALAACADRK